MITLIDYGGSNLRSVQKAFEFVGAPVQVSADAEVVCQAEKLVLPGVGAFSAGMAGLRRSGLDAAVREAAERGVLLLGICLGMQLLFEESDEMGRHKGLGLIPGQVVRLGEERREKREVRREKREERKRKSDLACSSPLVPRPAILKVPHVGWNQISHDGNHVLLRGVPSDAHAYFVHSYYCQPADPENIIAYTDYGRAFASVVGRDNVYGIQFHPEKSQKVGLQILHNFAKVA